MKTPEEICDMALGSVPIPDDMTFTAEEARSLVNHKVAELKQITEEVIFELHRLIEETTDDRVDSETIEVVKEYLNMVEEDCDFPDFANL